MPSFVIGLRDWSSRLSEAALRVMRHYGFDRLSIDFDSSRERLPLDEARFNRQ
jgi:hypothetical protein